MTRILEIKKELEKRLEAERLDRSALALLEEERFQLYSVLKSFLAKPDPHLSKLPEAECANLKKKLIPPFQEPEINWLLSALELKRQEEGTADVQQRLRRIAARIMDYLKSISKWGQFNLKTGAALAVLGIGFLLWFLTHPSTDADFSKFFIPRLSFVILIEVFAFFFLRLYSASLEGTKHFQNELTSLQLREIAILMLKQVEGKDTPENEKLRSDIIRGLMSSERNFILKAGETTVELERFRGDAATHAKFFEMFHAVLSRENRS